MSNERKQAKEVGRIVVVNELPDATHWEIIDVDHAHSMFQVRERGTDYKPQWIHSCQIHKYIWD